MDVKNFQIPVSMNGDTPHINIDALLSDSQFREFAIEHIASRLTATNSSCVVFLSYGSNTPLSQLVNLLAEKHHSTPQPLALVTKKLDDFFHMQHHRNNRVLLVKKVFHNGNQLEKQINKLREKGFDVHVLCLTAHSAHDVQAFAELCNADVKAILSLDKLDLK